MNNESGEAKAIIISYLFSILSSFRRAYSPHLAPPARLELTTLRLGGARSIQVSYGGIDTADCTEKNKICQHDTAHFLPCLPYTIKNGKRRGIKCAKQMTVRPTLRTCCMTRTGDIPANDKCNRAKARFVSFLRIFCHYFSISTLHIARFRL